MNLDRLKRDLRRHEGVRSKPYQDSLGIWTVGVGRNLNIGLSHDEIEYLFENDVNHAIQAARALVPMFSDLDHTRQEVLVNMAFNLGAVGLARFRKFLDAIDRLDFKAAAGEMEASRWFEQVGSRGPELRNRMLYGDAGNLEV